MAKLVVKDKLDDLPQVHKDHISELLRNQRGCIPEEQLIQALAADDQL